jgi:hypothetical protein
MEGLGDFESGFRLADLPRIPQAHDLPERLVALVQGPHFLAKEVHGIHSETGFSVSARWGVDGRRGSAIECLAFRSPAAGDVINYTAGRAAAGGE